MSLPNNRCKKQENYFSNKKYQAPFLELYSEEIDVLKFPHAVYQSFLSVFPFLSGKTMATAESAAIYRVKC
jgi:hypothetical protein